MLNVHVGYKPSTLGYQIKMQQTLLFFEKSYQIQIFKILNS